MAGAPGFEQIERFGAAHLADGNAVGSQAQRGAYEIGEGGDAVLGAHRHEIGRGALQLARVLDQHDPVGRPRDLRKQGVGQRRLAGPRAPGDEDVQPVGDARAQDLGIMLRHDAGGDIVGEREDRDRRLADREGRRGDDRRKQAFEAFSRFGQLGGDSRRTGVDFGSDMVGDETDDALAIGRRERFAGVADPAAEAVDPEATIGVEHDLDHRGIGQPPGNGAAERRAQHACAAGICFGLMRQCAHRLPRFQAPNDLHGATGMIKRRRITAESTTI